MIEGFQKNIFITQDGQACLAEFGIMGAFPALYFRAYRLGSLRYTPPERFSSDGWERDPNRHSREGDVYSLAMTSFSVRSSVKIQPIT